MTVSQEGGIESRIETFGFQLRNRFIYKLLIVYVLYYVIVLFTDPNISDNFRLLFTLLVLGPILPVWIMERKWNAIKIEDPAIQLQHEKVKSMRMDFYTAGIVVSIFLILLSQVITAIIGNDGTYYIFNDTFEGFETPIGRYNRAYPQASMIILFLYIVTIASFIVAYKLVFTRFNHLDPKKNRVFDYPAVPTTLLSYFFLGSLFSSLILYPFQNISLMTYTRYLPDFSLSLQSNFIQFSYHVFGSSLPVIVILPLFMSVIISFLLIYLPYSLDGRNIDFRKNPAKLQTLIVGLIVIPLIFSLIMYNMYPSTDGQNISYIYLSNIIGIIIGIGILVYFNSTSFTNKQRCLNCGYFGGNDECTYCNNENNDYSFEITGRNLKVPSCPNCKQPWDNLSRRCSNCKYTIVLTCENCSQTINPLWKKCNLCGTPRMPVPEIALTKPKDSRFAYVRSTMILWVVITIPFLIVDVILFYGNINFLSNLPPGELADIPVEIFLYDNYRRWITWIVFVFCIAFLLFRTSDSRNNQRLLITNQLIQVVYAEIIIMFIMVTIVISQLEEEIPLFIQVIPISIFIGIFYRRYKLTLSFDPYSIHIDHQEASQ